MIVAFTVEALRDLEEIGDYIAQDNPDRAESFIAEIRDKCLGIGAFPKSFPVAHRHVGSRIRKRGFRGYLIFYRIVGATVEIIHVLHGARDYSAILDI